jgi:Protein of unknown function (DUF3916)
MRRLDLHPLKKLRNPRRHLRSLRKWADGFARFDWSGYGDSAGTFDHWRIPIHAKLVSDRHTTPGIQAEIIQCLIDAAANLHATLPPACRHMPVAALITYPFLFNSEVTLFIDPDHFQSFKPRDVTTSSAKSDDCRIDVESSRVDILSKFGIALPSGARAGGYFMREIDFECPSCTFESEHWVVAFWQGD